MRSKAGKRAGPPTQAQLDQNEKFGMMVNFLKAFTNLVAITFKAYANRQTGFNAALSYNLQKRCRGCAKPIQY
jgi:hypothetical protein